MSFNFEVFKYVIKSYIHALQLLGLENCFAFSMFLNRSWDSLIIINCQCCNLLIPKSVVKNHANTFIKGAFVLYAYRIYCITLLTLWCISSVLCEDQVWTSNGPSRDCEKLLLHQKTAELASMRAGFGTLPISKYIHL